MISQEIYEYLASSSADAGSSSAEYSKLSGVIADKGVFVQILQDGMVTFNCVETQRLLRVLMQHSDSINDLVIKDYDATEE